MLLSRRHDILGPDGLPARLAPPRLFMPGFMGGGGSTADYRISRSLRFNAADVPTIKWTPSSAGNRRKFTVSFWAKFCSMDSSAFRYLFGAGDGNTISSSYLFYYQNKLSIYWGGAGGPQWNSNELFIDPDAWYHICWGVDTTDATFGNRATLEVGGTAVTWGTQSSGGLTAQNSDLYINNTQEHAIGNEPPSTGTSYPADMLLAEFYFIDGQKLAASNFITTHPRFNVPWPKKFTGTYGTNGRFYDFSDNASTTALGTDRSGNGNNGTLTNFSVTAGAGNDSLVDTPTNYGSDTGAGGEVRGNYCTMNPLTNFAGFTLTNGNLDIATTANNNTLVGTMKLPTSGLFKIEIDAVSYASGGGTYFGFINKPSQNGAPTAGSYLVFDTYSGNYTNGSTTDTNGLTGTNVTSNGDVWIICIDLTNGKVWIGRRRSGSTTWADGVTPAENGSGATTIALPSGDLYFCAFRGGSLNESYAINFGQRPWADTSTPAFKALCTQNLPSPSISKGSNGFVSAIATEANIETSLAALRSGWSSYVDILKNRSAAEGWALRFSHDGSNEYDLDGTPAYQARSSRTMSGSDNWAGYSIRVGADYGVAAGSVSHTNGAATTVTHNLGVTRNAILLFPRAGGDVLLHHPGCTAGSLLKLNDANAQSANTGITGIGANSFQIGSGMATGTYDYLVLAEKSGLIALPTHTGNASSDGPVAWGDGRPAWAIVFGISVGSSKRTYDTKRETGNRRDVPLSLNSNAQEPAAEAGGVDFLASGYKVRWSDAVINGSGSTYGAILLLENAFKYARAA